MYNKLMNKYWPDWRLLFNKIHQYYFTFALVVGVVAGFLVLSLFGGFTFFSAKYWLIVVIITILLSFAVRRTYFLVFIFMAGVILAGYQISIFNLNFRQINKFVGRTVELKGVITEDADISEKQISLRVQTSEIDGVAINSKIYITLSAREAVPRRSDEIILRGKLSEGFGIFAGSIWRANIIQVNKKPDFVRDVRDSFANKIREYIDSPAVDLGLGYLLGQKNALPSDLDAALKAVALTHIVVASGYNLTVLVRFSRKLFANISKRLSVIFSASLIIFFVLLVGFSPSMVRAGIVALLSLLLWYFGRKIQPLFLLIFVAAITLLINPGNIYDLGWQLSFGSFFGVMIVSPLLKAYFFGDQENLSSSKQILLETVSAQLATLPIILHVFGGFSLISILANLAVLPFVPAAMALTFAVGVAAYIWPFLAGILAFLASLVLNYSVAAINFFAEISVIRFEQEISFLAAVILYLGLIAACIYMQRATKADLSDSNLVA